MSCTQRDQRLQPCQQLCEAVCIVVLEGLTSLSAQRRKSWDVDHPGWHGVLRFSCKCVVGCTGPTGGASTSVIQEAGLGYKNDEKKTRTSWSAAARRSVWAWPSLALWVSLFIYSTSNMALFIGYRSSGSDLHCDFIFFFSPGRTLWKEGQDNRSLLTYNHTHVHTHTSSHSPCSPPGHLSVG